MNVNFCSARPFLEIPGESFTIPPFEAVPIEGYAPPPNFPNCCPFHSENFKAVQMWFDKFPDCCKAHANTMHIWHLKKSSYEGLPEKILNSLSYTEYHIQKRIDIPEWYEDITDYIDYIWWSFGHPLIGFHLYSRFLKNYLEVSKSKIPKLKRSRLIKYLEDFDKPKKPNEASKLDLNIIYDTFQKWVNTFPFELPYFAGLKKQYEGKILAFKEPARTNPYSKKAKAKAITQAELIDFLEVFTKRLIGEVQTHDFQISDLKQHRMKIENETLRVGTAELVIGYTKGELRYVTTIKKWLELQQAYFKAIVEISGSSDVVSSLKVQPLKTFAALFHSEEKMKIALNAARKCELIKENGTWNYLSPKTHAASAFWKAAVTSGLGKADMAKATVAKLIGEKFGINLSKNTISTIKGDYDESLYTGLLLAMKSR